MRLVAALLVTCGLFAISASVDKMASALNDFTAATIRATLN